MRGSESLTAPHERNSEQIDPSCGVFGYKFRERGFRSMKQTPFVFTVGNISLFSFSVHFGDLGLYALKNKGSLLAMVA